MPLFNRTVVGVTDASMAASGISLDFGLISVLLCGSGGGGGPGSGTKSISSADFVCTAADFADFAAATVAVDSAATLYSYLSVDFRAFSLCDCESLWWLMKPLTCSLSTTTCP